MKILYRMFNLMQIEERFSFAPSPLLNYRDAQAEIINVDRRNIQPEQLRDRDAAKAS